MERIQFFWIGANVGSHLLFTAAKGHIVWGVEPQKTNLVKMYHAAEIDNTTSRITFIQNVIDNKHARVTMEMDERNNGGSFVTENIRTGKRLIFVQSILLSDVFDNIVLKRPRQNPLTIIVKIDIERYECRAFLGSPTILQNPKFYIPYVLMEWFFAKRPSPYKYPKVCPKETVIQLANMFIENGYLPFSTNKKLLHANESHTWFINVIWQHKQARPFMKSHLRKALDC